MFWRSMNTYEYIETHFKCPPVFFKKEKYENPFKMAAGDFRRNSHNNKAVANLMKRLTACAAANSDRFEHLQ